MSHSSHTRKTVVAVSVLTVAVMLSGAVSSTSTYARADLGDWLMSISHLFQQAPSEPMHEGPVAPVADPIEAAAPQPSGGFFAWLKNLFSGGSEAPSSIETQVETATQPFSSFHQDVGSTQEQSLGLPVVEKAAPTLPPAPVPEEERATVPATEVPNTTVQPVQVPPTTRMQFSSSQHAKQLQELLRENALRAQKEAQERLTFQAIQHPTIQNSPSTAQQPLLQGQPELRTQLPAPTRIGTSSSLSAAVSSKGAISLARSSYSSSSEMSSQPTYISSSSSSVPATPPPNQSQYSNQICGNGSPDNMNDCGRGYRFATESQKGEVCGDGIKAAWEDCDDGTENGRDNGYCTSDCTIKSRRGTFDVDSEGHQIGGWGMSFCHRNGDPLSKGKTTTGWPDSCSNSSTISKSMCGAPGAEAAYGALYTPVPCPTGTTCSEGVCVGNEFPGTSVVDPSEVWFLYTNYCIEAHEKNGQWRALYLNEGQNIYKSYDICDGADYILMGSCQPSNLPGIAYRASVKRVHCAQGQSCSERACR